MPKIDSLTQILSKNVYFYMHLINSSKVTVLDKFNKKFVESPLKGLFVCLLFIWQIDKTLQKITKQSIHKEQKYNKYIQK